MGTNRDFKELLHALNAKKAKYLLIGGYAVAYYTEPRYTKDLDLWIASDSVNIDRVWAALETFGAPLSDVTKGDLQNPEMIYQIGVAPNRVNLVVQPAALSFQDAWSRREESSYDGETLPIIGLEDLIALKKPSARPRDQEDLRTLDVVRRQRKK